MFGKVPLLDITPSFKPDQAALSAQMMGYWTQFAATGNPNGGAAPRWPRFGGIAPQLQELIPKATAPESEAVFAGFHQCAFWATSKANWRPGDPPLSQVTYPLCGTARHVVAGGPDMRGIP